ncbi:MAG: ABC transporter permease [Planctomycetota bacterium]
MDYNGFLIDSLITHGSDSGHFAPLGHLMSAFVRIASQYSTVGVLLALCLGFSLATIVDQPLSPKDAANQLAGRIAPSDWSRTLIVSTDSSEDVAFAEELRKLAPNVSDSDSDNRFVRGTPQEIRRAILTRQTTTTAETTTRSPLLLVQSPDTIAWTLFENANEKFPGLSIQFLRPETMRWPNFLKSSNLINIVNQIVVIAIIAVGMTLVILTGGIDLSVGSLIALSSVVCARGIRDWGGAENATITTMLLAGGVSLVLCGLCGLFNGALIVGFSMPPFIATLGTMLMTSGFAFILSQGQSIDAVPENFIWLGRGFFLGIPVAVALMLLIYAVAQIVMKYTIYGRTIYAIGGNSEAAKLCGIRVNRWIVSTYVISSLLAGLGGLVMASRLKSGDAKYGGMYELYVIAAVVVGGTSLRGGYGSVFGTLIGALIIAVIENGMNLVHIESYTQKVVFGAIILLAVLLDRIKHAYSSSGRFDS